MGRGDPSRPATASAEPAGCRAILRALPRGPARTAPAHAVTAHLAQYDARHLLLLVVERGIERLEHRGERLHALGALRHPLTRAIEPVGQRRTLRGRTRLPRLLAHLPTLLPSLLSLVGPSAEVLLDRRPQLQLIAAEVECGLGHREPALEQTRPSLGRQPCPALRPWRLGKHDRGRAPPLQALPPPAFQSTSSSLEVFLRLARREPFRS